MLFSMDFFIVGLHGASELLLVAKKDKEEQTLCVVCPNKKCLQLCGLASFVNEKMLSKQSFSVHPYNFLVDPE